MNQRANENHFLTDESYRLEDRYLRASGRVFLTGTQALVRILLEQARADRVARLHTGGLVSGYRGSPLGGLDQELWRQRKMLAEHDIRFEPGLNEDLGATMLWGAQQIDAFPGKRVEGVFSMWYGKGPGVDRTGDVFRNANILGTSRHGGVLAVAGDDHAAQSSMFPHQTDHVFEGAMMPILFPSSVEEYVEFGLFGYALSRFSGLWVAFKAITETVESGRSMTLPGAGLHGGFAVPTDIEIPERGFGLDTAIRWPQQRAELERRLIEERLPAALAFARANPIDRTVVRPASARVGIITVGKAHLDVMAALRRLDLDTAALESLGIGVYKVGMSWPLEGQGVERFCAGMQALIVVEEKRSMVEQQIQALLYNHRPEDRPAVYGKHGPDGETWLPATMEFSPEQVAGILRRFFGAQGVVVAEARGTQRAGAEAAAGSRMIPIHAAEPVLSRKPFFCSGCPHNSSTRLPDGSYAAAGIGCHIMALGQRERTATFCQMGGEGVQWVGLSSFSTMPHLFVNLGDGTYQHSGSLAIRQAVAARTAVTYKILFNDAVAMTGGQPTEGGLTVSKVAAQLVAEGVREIVVVSEEPARYRSTDEMPASVAVVDRSELDTVQKRLREYRGVSAVIYDQTCAAEKRRRRKRGSLATPKRHIAIHPAVCEGCGDCSARSGCIAVEPLETELGRKRAVNQSACNKDMTCVQGYCPSFVTIEGERQSAVQSGTLQRLEAEWQLTLPPPATTSPELLQHCGVLVAGIGGTGIVTVGAILAMAAHLEGRGASTLDFTGLAQKNGAVVSHIQLAQSPDHIATARIEPKSANLLLGCDAVVAASPDVLARLHPGSAHAVVETAITPTADFVGDGDMQISLPAHRHAIERVLGEGRAEFHDWSAAAQTIFGDTFAANLMLVGHAFQRGWLPVSEIAIQRAIELNGAAVEANRRAFLWGRILAHDPTALHKAGQAAAAASEPFTIVGFVSARAQDLGAYQNAAYGRRYAVLVDRVARAEGYISGAPGVLTEAVARNYFKVLAYKDEYEVARLHTDPLASRALMQGFAPGAKRVFHMAPPILARAGSAGGMRRKIALKGWFIVPLMHVLRHGKVLRGTVLDPFGLQADRQLERRLIIEFERDVDAVLERLSLKTMDDAVALVRLYEKVRGFGHIKMRHFEEARPEFERLREKIGRSDR